jgi:hypothetical protein
MSLISQVATDEESRVADIVVRLQRRFSSIDREMVAAVVHDALREFDGAAVRDFVPILVEKHSRDVLARGQITP